MALPKPTPLRRNAYSDPRLHVDTPTGRSPVSPLSPMEAAATRRGAIEARTASEGPRLSRGWSIALFCALIGASPTVQAHAQTPAAPQQATPTASYDARLEGEATMVSVATVPTIRDPLEGLNRATFKFNGGADRYVMGPVARGYAFVMPRVVRKRVGAVLTNLGEPFTAVNDVLQIRGRDAGKTTSRFLINSTIGGLGLFDVASRLGVEGHESDFGQTLGRYGMASGPYVVLPLLGPTSVRDGVGQVVEIVGDPVSIATAGVGSFGLIHGGVEAIDGRASAEPMVRALAEAADPYATVRSAYAQNRASMVSAARGEGEALPEFESVSSR